ncbi:MAG: FxsA family protein, partial [Pseudomonadota bacterium]
MWILLALIFVPLIEIALFIQVGSWIGLWPTLATVVLTAVLGTWLLRSQGRGELQKLQRTFQEGGDPRGPLAHGALILVAGIVLLTPGFFTDAIGFALLIPSIRSVVIEAIAKRITEATVNVTVNGETIRTRHPREDVVD